MVKRLSSKVPRFQGSKVPKANTCYSDFVGVRLKCDSAQKTEVTSHFSADENDAFPA